MDTYKDKSSLFQKLNSLDTKVLIVDDDDLMRSLLKIAVTQWGYQVIEAGSVEEAWQIMQQTDPPMLLILDWKMPGLTGLDLCEMIRKKLDFYPYIIFLTVVSGAENILKGLEAGADEFLLKPVNFPDLQVRLFSGERIIKCIKIIEEQNEKLATYAAYTQVLEQLLTIPWEKNTCPK